MKNTILKSALVASALLVAPSAQALVALDGWQLDTNSALVGTTVNGLTTNIGHLNIESGTSTVTQEVNSSGNAFVGAAFSDLGAALSLTYTTESTTGIGDNLSTGSTSGTLPGTLKLSFSGLFGTVVNVDSLGGLTFVFTGMSAGGFIELTDNISNEVLANFSLASPSGGSLGNFNAANGTLGTSTILGLTVNSISNLFRDSTGASLVADLVNNPLFLQIITTNTLSPGATSSVIGNCSVGSTGNCVKLNLNSNGTANLFAVPEPASLAIMGMGLLMMGAVRRKA